MSEIEKEARLQAEERLPEHLIPPFDELKISRFVLAKMGHTYDEKEMLAEAEAESERVLGLEAAIVLEELERKNEHVKGLFLVDNRPEHSKPKYESGYAAGRGEDDTPVFVGHEKPKRIRWNAVIKNGPPGHECKFKLMDWVDAVDWYEHWDEDDKRILASLRRTYTDREQLVKHHYDKDLQEKWNIFITIWPREQD